MNTPTCIRAWRAPLARKASTRSPTGSRRWRRPKNRMPAGSSRRCFNLCDAFPRLFDLIDNSATGELDAVPVAEYRQVADACTLCDMCFMTKCPYVPPHEFNLDFPHTMLRYRAVEHDEGKVPWA